MPDECPTYRTVQYLSLQVEFDLSVLSTNKGNEQKPPFLYVFVGLFRSIEIGNVTFLQQHFGKMTSLWRGDRTFADEAKGQGFEGRPGDC